MIARIFAASLALAVTIPTLSAHSMGGGHDGVMVMEPFARETPPNAQVGGAYMTLMNHGKANRLTGARSNAADRVEIHNHEMDANGVMRMREVEGGLPIGENGTVTLQPGGLHIMFMGLKEPLQKGKTVDVTLEFEDGPDIDVTIPIKDISEVGSSGSTTHKH
jgi:copper(I)-binding protein